MKTGRVRSGSLMYPRPTQTPEKTITPGAPRGTGDEVLVDDVDVHVADGAAEGDPFAVRRPVHDLVDWCRRRSRSARTR